MSPGDAASSALLRRLSTRCNYLNLLPGNTKRMKKRTAPHASARTETLVAKTGEHCPTSGWWKPMLPEEYNSKVSSRFIGKGSVMPAVGGTPIIWVPSNNAHLQTEY